MFKKNRYLLFLIFIVAFLSLSGGFANALEVTSYPPIPGLVAPSSNCTGNDCLSIYVSYWFGLLVYIAGFLALISFTVGAVGYIISSENPTSSGNAKDRMKGSVLGLILTLSAFLILKTINLSYEQSGISSQFPHIDECRAGAGPVIGLFCPACG